MSTAVFKIWRGDANSGDFAEYTTEISEGMVVLDAVLDIQAKQANDLACRWNCKAGKCGSCSAEINGIPKLMCMTRLDAIPLDKPVTIEPMRAFPCIRDLAADVSWNFRVKKKIKKFKPRAPDAPDGTWLRLRQTLIVSRNFASASNASFAKTSAMFCEIIISTRNSSDRASWFLSPRSRCTRSTLKTACRN
jgi:succinate dehydrogenase/fumarate reductase-like Fe-S protein